MSRKGFTLVELSIVLVIIGLLIGGILVAQSMISSGKLVSQVSQLQQFDAGVANFRTKYNSLPGDSSSFSGNGDGIIEGNAYRNNTREFEYEIGNFWGTFDPSTYVANAPSKASISGTGKNVPAAKIGKPGSYVIVSSVTSNSGYDGLPTDPIMYAILDPSQAQALEGGDYYFTTTSTSNSAVKPIEMLALDAKMDDGLPASGLVISGSIGATGGGQNEGGTTPTALAQCSASGKYLTQNDTYVCTPLITVGSQTGYK